MANHVRPNVTGNDNQQDRNIDSMFVNEYAIDLTANNKNVKPQQSNKIPEVSLDDISGDSITTNKSVKEEKPTSATLNTAMPANVKSFDPTALFPKKEPEADEMVVGLMGALDDAVEREKSEIDKYSDNLREKLYEASLSGDLEAPPADPTSVPAPVDTKTEEDTEDDIYGDDILDSDDNDQRNIVIDIEEDDVKVEEEKTSTETTSNDDDNTVSIQRTVAADYGDLDYDIENIGNNQNDTNTEDTSAEDQEYLVESLKEETRKCLLPTNVIDLKSFRISSKGVKASAVIPKDISHAGTADWVMYNSGYPITMSGLSGPELIRLNPDNNRNKTNRNRLLDEYRILYDHVVDKNKPSFTEWMKQTKASDLDHIYFALYMATFNESNFVSYQCNECKKVFIKSFNNFDAFINYKDDATRKKVAEILSKDTNVGLINYDVQLVQASNKYVFGIADMSLYKIVEVASIPESFLDKYEDLINLISYIDTVYTIDYANTELVPVIIPAVKNDMVKTTTNRIRVIYDIMKGLSSDELYRLNMPISKISNAHSDELSYIQPAATCPDCNAEYPKENFSASSLLFIRHQLGAFASM